GQDVMLEVSPQSRLVFGVVQIVELDAGHAVTESGVGGRRVAPAYTSGVAAIQQVLGQHRHRTAGGALFLAATDPGGAGDVQVRPGVGLGETRQEAGGGDGAGLRPADGGDVGEGAVQLLLIVVEQRQLPAAVVGGDAGVQQLPHQAVVIAHQAGGLAAQGDDAGAGEGGDVHHGPGLEALGVGEG